MDPSAKFSLRLLGNFELERDGAPCKLAYGKGRALLAYLAAEPGRVHSRESIAAMLWPDMAREAALTNLRLVLHDLRQTLNAAGFAPPALLIDRGAIRLDPSSGMAIDSAEFLAPAPACPKMPCPAYCDPCLAQMEALADRYRGEFMEGFSLPECPDFDEWLQIQRKALHLRAIVLLARLSGCHERAGAYAKALPFALRFLDLEPWNEDGMRRAMRLLALNGQRDSALTQYEENCLALKRELGVLPSAETLALAERIRRGELSPAVDRRLPAPAAVPPLAAAERRQVTVLYCELAPIGAEGPDEAMALLGAPQARCNEIIRGYSGHLVQDHGGGLLAYFGYPQASENAARLAVHAALAVSRAAFPGVELRAGIHTGPVIGGGDSAMPDALGVTSGLAIHLCQMAGCGELVVSAATQHLVAGYFECMSLGCRQFFGISRPLEIFKIARESGATSRLEASAKLTPLVGRRNEIASLVAAWQDVRRGARRIVLLRGEAGIGKSRLVLTFSELIRDQHCIVREMRCFPEYSQSPFYPLIVMLEVLWGFVQDDTPEQRFAKLAGYIEAHYPAPAQDAVPLLARLLSLPCSANYREPGLSPREQKKRTLAMLLGLLHALAAQQPVLLIVEDMHWIDPSSLELLTLFVEKKETGPVFAVFTARPEFAPPWKKSGSEMLELAPLAADEVAEMVVSISGEIPAATVGRIVERADGIPLFAEEMAKVAAPGDRASIPATLQDLLEARLDSVGEAKRTAQFAAAIGREFGLDLLRRITPCSPAALARSLKALLDAGLILKVNKTTHQFKHALIQEAAYQSQTKADRQDAHRRIAQVLHRDFPGIAAAQPELLAQHFSSSGESRQAIEYWIKAGKLASQRSACQEAVGHFKSGLALIEALAFSPDRARMELDLQIGLGAAACAAQGYGSAEGAQAYARAMALCGQHESSPDAFCSVWGLWASASSRIGYPRALELAQQLLRMAGLSGDPVQSQQGHFAVADTLYWQGHFVVAREHLERARALYLPAHHTRHLARFGEDAGVTCGAYLSWVLWFLGFPVQAREAGMRAVALARQLGHPFSLAYALTFAAILHCRLRQPGEAQAVAEETLALASEHGFPLWHIGATIARGWALAMQNRREGIESLQQCVEAMREAMGGVTLAVMAPLADAYMALGLCDQALRVIDEAFTVGNAIGDHHVDAELHRLKGEALLGRKVASEAQAEACFRQALEISRKQQAKSLELRAAVSMARLLQKQGKRGAAGRLLEEAYPWFTEGFDTTDLQDALKLMDELGSQHG